MAELAEPEEIIWTLIRERNLAKQVAAEAMKLLTDEQLVELRTILDRGGADGSSDSGTEDAP
jgi:hypothetical protein